MAGFLFSLACVALAFGLGGIYLSTEPGPMAVGNLILSGILVISAVVVSAVSVRRQRVGLSRRALGVALLHAGIAVIVTGGVLFAASRLSHEWDLTEPRIYSLSEFSRQVLEDLNVDIDAVYVGDPAVSGQERLLIERFAQASQRFRLKIVSPQELSPEGKRQLERTGSQLVFYSGGRARRVPAVTERVIIQTVLDFSMRASTKLCFATGHGEPSLEGSGPNGFSSFRNLLAHEGFQATHLLLAAQPDVPDECEIVVIAAPEKGLLPAERNRLGSYLDTGGRLLVFAEPGRPIEPAELLEPLGITALDALVVDEASSLFGSEAKGTEPIVNRFTDYHPVVQGLSERTGVVFSGVRPLILRGSEPRGFVYSDTTSRIETPQGEGPTAGDRAEEAEPLPGWMRREGGPYPLGASLERSTEPGDEARIVVFGDVDFATNRLLGALYNEDLLMNAVYYLANREDQIQIRPKVEDLYQAPLIPEKTFAAFNSVALLIPEAILVLGLVAWYRRRRL
jgi:hypothetical protein